MFVTKLFHILRVFIVCFIAHILMIQTIEILHDFMYAIMHVMMKFSIVCITGVAFRVIIDIITD